MSDNESEVLRVIRNAQARDREREEQQKDAARLEKLHRQATEGYL